jgi:hypothetical protein
LIPYFFSNEQHALTLFNQKAKGNKTCEEVQVLVSGADNPFNPPQYHTKHDRKEANKK